MRSKTVFPVQFESNTWQQIRAKTELRNISGGPRGGIAARETQPSADQLTKRREHSSSEKMT